MKIALVTVAERRVVRTWDKMPERVEIPLTQEVITQPFIGWDNGEYRLVQNGK